MGSQVQCRIFDPDDVGDGGSRCTAPAPEASRACTEAVAGGWIVCHASRCLYADLASFFGFSRSAEVVNHCHPLICRRRGLVAMFFGFRGLWVRFGPALLSESRPTKVQMFVATNDTSMDDPAAMENHHRPQTGKTRRGTVLVLQQLCSYNMANRLNSQSSVDKRDSRSQLLRQPETPPKRRLKQHSTAIRDIAKEAIREPEPEPNAETTYHTKHPFQRSKNLTR